MRPVRTQVAMLGPLGPPQLACFSSWRAAGIATHFLDTEERPLPRRLRRIVDRYDYIGPVRELDADVLRVVLAALEASGSTHLCCVGEQLAIRVWQQLCELRESPPRIELLINPANTMLTLESKQAQIGLARQAGFDVLPTERIDAEAVVRVASSLRYPLVLRPDRASTDSKFKAEYIVDPAALCNFFSTRRSDAPAVIAQPFIRGPNLVVHGYRGLRGEVGAFHCYIGRVKHQGVTVCLEAFEPPAKVLAACSKFVDRLDLHGVFHFDLLLDPASEEIWFLEINARMGGTTAKVLAGGYDEPRALLEAFGLIPPSPIQHKRETRPVVNRLAAAKSLAYGLLGKGSPIDYPYPARIRLSLDCLHALLFYRDELLSLGRLDSVLAFFSQYRPRFADPL